jgi:NTE family protein
MHSFYKELPMIAPRLAHALVATFIALVAHDALAQAMPPQRPRVGLVLGGGGARGGAHIGVLEVLEELRIPFDCVAGTSMGALVGGAYAAGISPEEMRKAIQETDWGGIFEDNAGREDLNLRRKQLDDRFLSALEFGATSEGLRYREGAVAGEKLKLFFNKLVRSEYGEIRIEELKLPLTLMATDIGNGQRVAMRSGALATAMRGSMSVPGAVAPIVREGHKLVDGGLVDNVPIQEVRERCGAQVVIAINVGSPILEPEAVQGVLSVVAQMVNLLTEQNVSRSLALLQPQDIYMRPELGTITAANFERQLEAAAIGRKTAEAQLGKLRALSVTQAQYDAWKSNLRAQGSKAPPRIDAVQIAGTTHMDPRTLRESITQKEGEPLDTEALSRDLILLYSQGDLQTVDYSVLTERDKTILRVTPVEKAWGPDYLRFGINLSSDFHDADFNLRALYRRTWLNYLGGEWLTVLQVGSSHKLATEFYQPLDRRARWFVNPYISVEGGKTGIYVNGARVADYESRGWNAGVDAGANLGVIGQARIGWQERKTRAQVETGPPALPDVDLRAGGPRAKLNIDTYDFAFFPTRGYKLDASVFDAQRVAGDQPKYGVWEAKLGAAMSFRDLIFLGALEGGAPTHGELPVTELFTLGGPRRLAGFAQNQIVGEEYAYARLDAQYRLTRPIPLLGLSLIAGVSAETGRMRNPINEPTLSGWQSSFSAYLATNSAFGPIYFGLADARNGKARVFFFVGTP